jgi:hypothetical protein
MAAHQQWISGAAVNQTIAVGAINFNTDGTCTPHSGSGATPTNWFSAQNADIGASYWINITRTGGSAGVNFSAAQGVWTKISSIPGSGSIGVVGGIGSCSGTYQIAAGSAGSPVKASGTISCANNI